MESKINKKWLIAFAIIVTLLPIILNWLITRPAFFEFVGNGTDWLGFWVTYVSAIASFAMVVITWMTLKQNEAQLNEIKRQWEEEQRPKIEVYFTFEEGFNHIRYLEVFNTGKSPARNLKFSVSANLLSMTDNKDIKNALTKLGNDRAICLFPNESMSFVLYEDNIFRSYGNAVYKISGITVDEEEYNRFKELLCNSEITIIGSYNDKYEINATISCSDARHTHQSLEEIIRNTGNGIAMVIGSLKTDGIKVEIKDQK